ncbi:MAG: hypothetical protein NZM12_04670, partial [Steroidobacteraceae bacterium]|nr:hypothetical protein [Steroidobacteraceae bacterium]MDW8259457.1 ACT domain-containing protein [Gammaproteobacteria bacterium]
RVGAAAPTRVRRHAAARKTSSPITIDGVGNLPITIARCCGPVRPEPIVGYITLGRGLTVHAERCRSLARMRAAQPQRIVAVHWHAAEDATLPVELAIVSFDRRGLVRDISDAIAADNISIDSLNTVTDHSNGTAHMRVCIGIRDQTQLERLLRALRQVPSVMSVRRIA